jgi:hypothetical protein
MSDYNEPTRHIGALYSPLQRFSLKRVDQHSIDCKVQREAFSKQEVDTDL